MSALQFFCYHRDREGSTPLRAELTEEHWSYMDRFVLIARGPTFLDDDTLTGSVHVVELPDVTAARAFVFDEPSYQAGAYRDVLLRRTVWRALDSSATGGDLAIGFLDRPEPYTGLPTVGADLAGFGPLLSDDGATAPRCGRPGPDRGGGAGRPGPVPRRRGAPLDAWRPSLEATSYQLVAPRAPFLLSEMCRWSRCRRVLEHFLRVSQLDER